MKAARTAAWGLALHYGVKRAAWQRVLVDREFHPPARYHYDMDNLDARMKPYLDGLSQAIGIDDRHFTLAAPVLGDVVKGGMVVVRLSEAVEDHR